MKSRLRTIAAVFRTAAGLDREQGGKLYRIRVEMFAMRLLRMKQQIGEGQLEQRFDRGDTPVVLRSIDLDGTDEFDRLSLQVHV